MRTEKEMLDLILNTAKNDERIRAVIMNGSRVNPNVSRDIFQDFDIIYVVRDISPYINNTTWIKRFGELMIFQMPDLMGNQPSDKGGIFSYLMQFTDGNRIDLKIFPITKSKELFNDSLSVLLLDKDGIIERFPSPDEKSYLPQPPTAKEFEDCCNEFWWVCTYVAKGLWRGQIAYAKCMFDQVVRAELMKMITWQIGINTRFQINPGLHGKYFQKYLKPDHWQMFLDTYSDADIDHTWHALITICDLFREISHNVADHFSFHYPLEEDRNVTKHIMYVRTLPPDT